MYWLSLDWDFFCREESEWDWGHAETDLFQTAVWEIRAAQLENPRKTTALLPYPKPFLKRLAAHLDFEGCRFLQAADSHKYAFRTFEEAYEGTILQIDAHHDIAYSARDTVDPNKVDCSNWLIQRLASRPNLKLVVVYPPWKGLREAADIHRLVPQEILSRVEFRVWPNLPPPGTVSGAFCCRSGGWAPPWHDRAFTRFLAGLEEVCGCSRQMVQELPVRKFSWKRVKALAGGIASLKDPTSTARDRILEGVV